MTEERIKELGQRSAFALRTYVVGSVLPMCRNRINSGKVQVGLAMLLGPQGPDAKGLSVICNDGLALRAVCWKTSGCLLTHSSIMQMAGDDGTGRSVATMDPSLGCLRSLKFLAQLCKAMEDESISDVDRSVLVGATLSLVCSTPAHPCIAQGAWQERTVDVFSETLRYDSAHIISIPTEEKAALREKIENTLLSKSIEQAEAAVPVDTVALADLHSTLKSNRKGWDPEDRERALALIESSVLFLAGSRHTVSERDGLLMDPSTCDVSCSQDVSRRNSILLGKKVLDVPLQMFTLHLGVVVAAAVRVLARLTGQDRDQMMETLMSEEPFFQQHPYLAKLIKRAHVPAPGAAAAIKDKDKGKGMDMDKGKKSSKDAELVRLAAELSAFKVHCEARIRVLERRQSSPKRSRTE